MSWNRVRLIFLSTLVAGLLVTPSASADTITVCAAACDWTTIQEAVDSASDGDVINVAAGNYPENVDVDTVDVTITGAKADADGRTRAVDAGETVIDAATGYALSVANATVVVDGLVLRGGSASSSGGLLATSSSVTLRDSIVDRGYYGVRATGTGAEALLIERVRLATSTFAASATSLLTATVQDAAMSTTSGSGKGVVFSSVATSDLHDSSVVTSMVGTAEGVSIGGASAVSTSVRNNVIEGYVPGVDVLSSTTGAVAANHNRFGRKTESADVVDNDRIAAINIDDNWFDCVGTPAIGGTCDVLGTGTLAPATWISAYVTTAAVAYQPADIPVTVTVRRSDGAATPAGMTNVQSLPVTFTKGSTLDATSSFLPVDAVLVGGVATSALRSATVGTHQVQATIGGNVYSTSLAVRYETPSFTALPKVAKVPRIGTVVVCLKGSWTTGSGFVYTWTRDGVPVANGGLGTYTPVAADLGHLLACRITLQRPNQDSVEGTSPALKVLKRIPILAMLQTTPLGRSLACGTIAKLCLVKRGTVAYAKLAAHASHPAALKAGLVIETKVGRRWKPRLPVVKLFGVKALPLPTKSLPAGSYRFRIVYRGSALDMPAASPYRYFKVR
ncbi:MAG: hypothetical protein JWM86_827 [Thermoleophilia bacterium]|nr:hypothetical protein [Thermoleophilia bacterium]